MNEITKGNIVVPKPAVRGRTAVRLWRPLLAAAAVAAVILLAWMADQLAARKGPRGTTERGAAFRLLSQAQAAEENLFRAAGILHIINEVQVMPVSDKAKAEARWLPLCSLGASGKPEFHHLSLSAAPGEKYTVADEAWYDAATGRFARILDTEGKVVFAHAYDGEAVYLLQGAGAVQRQAVSAGFKAPASPAGFLGIGAGLPSQIQQRTGSLVEVDGQGKLADGSPATILKAAMPGPEGKAMGYVLFRIRDDDKTIAEMELFVGDESQLLVRRVSTETVPVPRVPWNLEGVTGEAAPGVTVRPHTIRTGISLQEMVASAAFETYVFSAAPAWAPEGTIVDVLDVASPPQRMFLLAYRASDGRHVVLVQSPSYNRMLARLVKTGRLVYESPNGFKVWSRPRDKWLADILLKSARAWIKDEPAADRTGHVLESPAGTFPCLAVNGALADEELHSLVDSIVPAKTQAGR